MEKVFKYGLDSKIKVHGINRLKISSFHVILLFLVTISLFDILTGCTPCAPNDKPGPEELNEKEIYFTGTVISDNQPAFDICGINRDGSETISIIHNGEISSAPALQKIIYLRPNETGSKYALMSSKINGRNNRMLLADTSFSTILLPVLSPKADKIAFYAGNNTIMLADTDLTTDTRDKAGILTTNFCNNTLPAFSPDNNYIAFFEGVSRRGPVTLKIFSLAANSPAEVFSRKFANGVKDWTSTITLDWSSDNQTVVFALSGSGNSDTVYLMNIQGQSREFIVNDIGASMPVISPVDKNSLAFAARDGSLYFASVIPGEIKRLTKLDTTSYVVYPQWSPDGKNILYTRYSVNGNNGSIYQGVLEVIDAEKNKNSVIKEATVLYNNAYRGFWYKKK